MSAVQQHELTDLGRSYVLGWLTNAINATGRATSDDLDAALKNASCDENHDLYVKGDR